MDNKKPTILLVDDETSILRSLKRMLRQEPYIVKTANTPNKAIDMARNDNFHVIISDYRMPGMNGVDMFLEINKQSPDSVKIILSGYADMSIITDALNQEYIDKYILKPWNENSLKREITNSIDHCRLVQTNKQLHEKVLNQNKELLKINEHLEDLVRQRTTKLEVQNKALRTSQNILNNIPIPVLGIDMDFLVVMTNELANKKFPDIIPGQTMLIEEIRNMVKESISKNQEVKKILPKLIKDFPTIHAAPLKTIDRRKGCIITFLP